MLHVALSWVMVRIRLVLRWYGYVSHLSGLAKTILQGTVKGGRRLGRQRKRWKDNIREWTGLDFVKSQRAVENREKWRKLVVKSSVVPQEPSRLRERLDGVIRVRLRVKGGLVRGHISAFSMLGTTSCGHSDVCAQ